VPQINIPGVGLVEFPYDMTDEQVQSAAARLYQDASRKPASSEDFAPAPRTNQLPTDPSASRTWEKFVSGAKEGIPRMVQGITRLNPLGLGGTAAAMEAGPGALEAIKGRISDYANDPLKTINDDPFAFAMDALSIADPAMSAGRGVTSMAGRAIRSVPAAAGTAADLGIDAAVGAVKAKLPGGGGSAVRGAIREAAQGYAKRKGAASAAGSADEVAKTIIDPVPEELVPGYDRYMPNRGASSSNVDQITERLLGQDMPAPQRPMSMKDDAVTRSIQANGGQADLLRELLRAEQEAQSGLTRAGRTMLTPEERMMFNRATARPSYGQ
jgi:hypothetical protein